VKGEGRRRGAKGEERRRGVKGEERKERRGGRLTFSMVLRNCHLLLWFVFVF
jgi:hypothetical protein